MVVSLERKGLGSGIKEACEAHESEGEKSSNDEAHSGTTNHCGHFSFFCFFTNTGHEDESESEAAASTESIDDPSDQTISFVGGEDSEAKDCAVRRDEREVDTEGAEESGTEFFDDHLDELDGTSDDDDEADQAEVGGVDEDVGIQDPSTDGGDEHDEDGRNTEAKGCFQFGGNAEEWAEAQKHGEGEVIDEKSVDEDPQ